ncbi:MAG: Esterase/lipase [Rhodobacteraceae bacterium HLUCCA08]|nr:MAG: Esterase/lipase [Rhodobacteraceae bacterium HLUCCA08]
MAGLGAANPGPLNPSEVLDDSRTFAFRLFRALPDSLTGLRMLHLMARPPRLFWPKDIRIGLRMIESQSPGRQIPLWILRPRVSASRLPVVLNLHGGGHAIGAPQQDFGLLAQLTAQTPCVVVTPDYRLSLREPYPAALEDCADALRWVFGNAAEHGGDPDRLYVMGHSSGGGLAAALGLLSRNQAIPKLAGLLLIGAMLDDRTGLSANPDLSWNAERNTLAWRLYLRGIAASGIVPETAAPARTADLSSLPATFGVVGAADLFLQENASFFERLSQHGVPAPLAIVPHAYHGIEVLAPKSGAGDAMLAAIRTGFARMLELRPK